MLGALADAAAAGPFFSLAVGDDGRQWLPATAAYCDGLRSMITATGSQLGVSEARVAASTLHMALAARLWSPVLCCGLLHGVVPDLAHLRIGPSPPLRLSLPEPRGWHVRCPDSQDGQDDQTGQGDIAALAYHVVVDGHLEPLSHGLPVKVASGLLRGNAAATMTGALRVLTCARPETARAARPLAQALLATGMLRGTGSLAGPGLEFLRRSCCLYYRVPGGGMCSDCPLPGHAP